MARAFLYYKKISITNKTSRSIYGFISARDSLTLKYTRSLTCGTRPSPACSPLLSGPWSALPTNLRTPKVWIQISSLPPYHICFQLGQRRFKISSKIWKSDRNTYVSFFNDVEITNSSLFNCFNNYVSKFCFQSLVGLTRSIKYNQAGWDCAEADKKLNWDI